MDWYNANCQIDNSFVQGGRCSGSYVNGAFNYYPPFAYAGCQCNDIIEQMKAAKNEEAKDKEALPYDVADRNSRILQKDFGQLTQYVKTVKEK